MNKAVLGEKMRKTSLFIVLILHQHLLSTADQNLSCGDSKEYAIFNATVNNSTFSICDPIILSCTLFVTSEKKVFFAETEKTYDFEIVVLDVNKKKVPFTLKGDQKLRRGKFLGPMSMREYPVIKGDSITTQFLLNQYFDLTLEGSYTITLSVILFDTEINKRISIQSNTITFFIENHETVHVSDTIINSSFVSPIDDLLK